MKTYNQYCPIARSSEILAQRWTPVIIRTLLNGPSTYTVLADQAPGIPRSLLTSRLRELQTSKLVTKAQDPATKGKVYELTESGQDLATVINAMGQWGERWLDVTPQHADPVHFLNSWINSYLNHDTLLDRRVTVRFEFTDQPVKVSPMWVIFEPHHSEVCRAYPGYEEDLIVTAESVALAEWHLGRIEWHHAVQDGRINISGIPQLAKALPTWNQRSRWTASAHPQTIRS
ncbi:MAG: helix-turn-helix domain-containing protein [Actinomycetota bacterium]|nr:helix-turn-helix domain-containing protein [Actinomycetota bacterium]